MINKTYKITPKRTIIYALVAGVLTGLTSLQVPVYAAIYKADSNKRINIEISQLGVNRIEVKKDRIAKVIGNIDEYSIEGDNKTGAIFLSAKGIAGEIVPITIITEKGYTQDINFKVKKASEPKTVIIEKPVLKEVKRKEREVRDIKKQVIEAIKDISKGEDRNFTKRDISLKEINNYKKQQNPSHNLSNNLVWGGYQALEGKQVMVTKVIEYSNRFLRLIKYEYQSKPSAIELKQISELFRGALSVSIRGNVIIVVYQI